MQHEIYLYFYNLSPSCIRKVWGQQRRIGILRLGVKGLIEETLSWICMSGTGSLQISFSVPSLFVSTVTAATS